MCLAVTGCEAEARQAWQQALSREGPSAPLEWREQLRALMRKFRQHVFSGSPSVSLNFGVEERLAAREIERSALLSMLRSASVASSVVNGWNVREELHCEALRFEIGYGLDGIVVYSVTPLAGEERPKSFPRAGSGPDRVPPVAGPRRVNAPIFFEPELWLGMTCVDPVCDKGTPESGCSAVLIKSPVLEAEYLLPTELVCFPKPSCAAGSPNRKRTLIYYVLKSSLAAKKS